MASGGRYGLAQSTFQTGGNIGSALGPLTAAFVVPAFGQRGVAWYAGAALLAILVLFNIGNWYKHHGLARIKAAHRALAHDPLPRAKVLMTIFILALLIFSKYFYLVSISNYFTFYLIQTFHVSVQSAQVHLFAFLGAVAVGAFAGGPLGDRFGRKYVIWFFHSGHVALHPDTALRQFVLDGSVVGDHRPDHGVGISPPSWFMPRNSCPDDWA